jgi:hypothetical protein
MDHRLTMLLLAVLLWGDVPRGWCAVEECEPLKSATSTDAVNYLEQNHSQTAECAKVAFQVILHLPQQEAIPILTKHLGYKRPLTEAEQNGFFARGPYTEVLYPAVQALYDIGGPAESALIDVIARSDEGNIERTNALYTLNLIRHSDVVAIIRMLHERSLSIPGTPASGRLDATAQELRRRYCRGKLREACEDALGQ